AADAQVSHVFNSVGSHSISVTATDQNGGTSAPATSAITVTAVQLLPNAQNSSLMDLVWLGTGGADQVKFEQISPTSVRVRTLGENGASTNVIESFSGVTGRVIASGGAADDTLDASALTATQTTLDGQAGNNKLYGGQAGDILIGGSNGAEGRQ